MIEEIQGSIRPAFPDGAVVVCLGASNSYVPYASVAIQSIIDASGKDRFYDIILFESDISEWNKRLLLSLIAECENISLRFADPWEYFQGYYHSFAQRPSIAGAYRLAIPEMLSSDYRKAIYLDDDIVVRADLAELMDVELEDNYAAAVRDIGLALKYGLYRTDKERYRKHERIQRTLKNLKNPSDYFNNGVMILNLEMIRRDFTVNRFLDHIFSQEWVYPCQDSYNILFEGKVSYLHQTWNCFVPTRKGRESFAPKEIYEDYLDALENPKLIHYSGRNLPTMIPDTPLFNYFWEVARKTPFYELLLFLTIEEQSKKFLRQDGNTTSWVFHSF